MSKPLKILYIEKNVLYYVYNGKNKTRKLTDKEVKKYQIAIKWRRAWRCPHCLLRQSPIINGCPCAYDKHPPFYCVGCGRPTAKPLNN